MPTASLPKGHSRSHGYRHRELGLTDTEYELIIAVLGRHPNDLVTSFYMHTPSDILVEYGWGGAEVDDATWQPQEMTTVGSYWGHHGLFEAIPMCPTTPSDWSWRSMPSAPPGPITRSNMAAAGSWR